MLVRRYGERVRLYSRKAIDWTAQSSSGLAENLHLQHRRDAWHTKTGTGSPVPWAEKAGKTIMPRKRGMIGSNL